MMTSSEASELLDDLLDEMSGRIYVVVKISIDTKEHYDAVTKRITISDAEKALRELRVDNQHLYFVTHYRDAKKLK